MEIGEMQNFIVLRMKNSEIILIQLIDSRTNKLHITENIKFKGLVEAQE
jgi:hypothetical protein